jgi:putative FmdB family regulatory protein
MPIYTYKCQTCNSVFSISEALFEKPITQCPSCITGVVRRIPQQPVVFFDNSGRYASHRHIPHGEAHGAYITPGHGKSSQSLNKESKG